MKSKLRAIVSIRETACCIAIALCICLAPTSRSHAGPSPWQGAEPVFVMFDGITFSPTVSGCFGLGLRRGDPSTDYLAGELEEAGWGSFGSFREPPVPGHGKIFSVAWDGDLSDRERILNYIGLAKSLIKNRIQQVPDRPIIVVAHSWGSVVAYQALRELDQEFNDDGRRVVPAESIAQFVTLGSPLRTQSSAVLNAIDFCFPDTPAGDQIWGTLSKPDTVSYWTNAWNTADCVSGGIPSADTNVALNFLGHVIGDPPAPGPEPASCDIVNTVSAHRSYYGLTEGHSHIQQIIRTNLNTLVLTPLRQTLQCQPDTGLRSTYLVDGNLL